MATMKHRKWLNKLNKVILGATLFSVSGASVSDMEAGWWDNWGKPVMGAIGAVFVVGAGWSFFRKSSGQQQIEVEQLKNQISRLDKSKWIYMGVGVGCGILIYWVGNKVYLYFTTENENLNKNSFALSDNEVVAAFEPLQPTYGELQKQNEESTQLIRSLEEKDTQILQMEQYQKDAIKIANKILSGMNVASTPIKKASNEDLISILDQSWDQLQRLTQAHREKEQQYLELVNKNADTINVQAKLISFLIPWATLYQNQVQKIFAIVVPGQKIKSLEEFQDQLETLALTHQNKTLCLKYDKEEKDVESDGKNMVDSAYNNLCTLLTTVEAIENLGKQYEALVSKSVDVDQLSKEKTTLEQQKNQIELDLKKKESEFQKQLEKVRQTSEKEKNELAQKLQTQIQELKELQIKQQKAQDQVKLLELEKQKLIAEKSQIKKMQEEALGKSQNKDEQLKQLEKNVTQKEMILQQAQKAKQEAETKVAALQQKINEQAKNARQLEQQVQVKVVEIEKIKNVTMDISEIKRKIEQSNAQPAFKARMKDVLGIK